MMAPAMVPPMRPATSGITVSRGRCDASRFAFVGFERGEVLGGGAGGEGTIAGRRGVGTGNGTGAAVRGGSLKACPEFHGPSSAVSPEGIGGGADRETGGAPDSAAGGAVAAGRAGVGGIGSSGLDGRVG